MTRRDYVMLSATLKRARSETPERNHTGLDVAACQIAHALAQANPNGFDRARFLVDCGVAP